MKFDKHPLKAPQIEEKTQRKHSFRLSDKQIVLGFLCAGTLIILGILHGQNQAQFYVQGIRWESLGRFCRVSFTVKNARKRGINAQAVIRVFKRVTPAGNEHPAFNDLAGSVKVPIRLAGNESRTVVVDVIYSGKTYDCDAVDVTRVNGGN